MKGKRAQAAMEFLMTYGWAILIILVAIAALAYFGVLNPTRYVANRCVLPVPMACDDFVVNTQGIQVRITNGEAKRINVTALNATGFGDKCKNDSVGIEMDPGESALFTLNCGLDPTNEKLKHPLVVTYTVGVPPLVKKSVGEIYSSVSE